MSSVSRVVSLSLAMLLSLAMDVHAEDAWNPFKQKDVRERAGLAKERADRQLPSGGPDDAARWRSAPQDASAASVERGELPPLLANDVSGLPLELWHGLDLQAIEQHVASIETAPRSRALHALWKRLWTSTASPPGGAQVASRFLAIRIEALYRAGLLAELRQVLDKEGSREGPLVGVLEARTRIASNDRERGCALIRSIVGKVNDLPKPLGTETLLMSGYCAAAAGNTAAAGLAADMLHERQAGASIALAALDALATGTKPQIQPTKRVSLLDFRILELTGAGDAAPLLEKAEPALLFALANDRSTDWRMRIAAGEAASRLNAIEPAALADIYRAATFTPEELASPTRSRAAPELKRALMLRAAELEHLPAAKARLLRSLLDDARRSGLHVQTAAIIGHQLDAIAPAPELAWFAETALEASLAAGRIDQARRWAGVGSLRHWLALAAIADAHGYNPRDPSLDDVAELASRSRLSGDFLHRLATVLDSLDFQVPIALWDAANRTPQPTTGHLPDTGVLTQLQDAAKKKEVARTALLAMRTLGPEGTEGAHLIALGDAIKALKRAGLGGEAHRLGFEALFASWPRTQSQ